MNSGVRSLAALVAVTELLTQTAGVTVNSVQAASGHEAAFASFIEEHGRVYAKGSEEYHERLALYTSRAQEVERLNTMPNRRWTAGINKFADRNEKERAKVRGWKGMASAGGPGGYTVGRAASFLSRTGRATPLPNEFNNWTNLETVKNVRDQGGCGSCWAVTAGTVLDAHAEIHTRAGEEVPKYSMQQIVSCTPNPHKCGGAGGCEGATVELAYSYVLQRGIKTAAEMPYAGVTGTCEGAAKLSLAEAPASEADTDVAKVGLHTAPAGSPARSIGMVAYERLPENKYEPLMRALVEHGPVGISVAAADWFAYQSGVFDGCQKDAVIDHAVTLVGYGVDGNNKYWDIQNSWGPSWGENGRIRLLRRDSEEEWCGVDNQPEVGTACEGGPKQVTVCGSCGILYDSTVPHFGSN
eukprot:CAMPEP_0195061604 /NCGR_PEP_ID=MMETSP0448-20130528/8454_1 /TAXON_ID=66468 /ORGANISM="Heterocapsa triquestra, Strain CCMP 448" /LENGTH=411 /DNA_ID=CAMNT_0040092181 /DNA_START=120 /DNA_END=1355 /DNA_ORIENTATION=+